MFEKYFYETNEKMWNKKLTSFGSSDFVIDQRGRVALSVLLNQNRQIHFRMCVVCKRIDRNFDKKINRQKIRKTFKQTLIAGRKFTATTPRNQHAVDTRACLSADRSADQVVIKFYNSD